ncbi:NAD-dependent deacetylase [Nocardia stercoris]|uniref:protein acetyllysine N-acetyltransferase n=1 Tax=Nocardia stercoris TaxID=2483361 RepID=A0A3M2L441_9NOCA|nr:NAD-dependent deacetylase [Nocardia stercoris]
MRRIAVLSGAGISTDSGIPDYRGPSGVWTADPDGADVVTIESFLQLPDRRRRLWAGYANSPVWQANPNAAHRALAELARTRAVRVLTQNIDGLQQRAGLDRRKVLELHGSMWTSSCLDCGTGLATAAVLERVHGGESDPACAECGGILKPDVVMFGQHLDPQVIGQAQTMAGASDLLLAVGTTLLVEPAASLCAIAVETGARLVVVNRDPTPYDAVATAVIREPIGTALPRICAALTAR